MLRLVLGKLYDGAAILPGKLDERLRRIAAEVNGGLTGANIDPAYGIPVSRFQHGRSTHVCVARMMNGSYGNPAVGTDYVYAVSSALPVASRLDKAILIAAAEPTSGLGGVVLLRKGAINGANVVVGADVEWSSLPLFGGSIPAAAGKTVRVRVDTPALALAAYDTVYFNWAVITGGGVPGFKISGVAIFQFSFPHTA